MAKRIYRAVLTTAIAVMVCFVAVCHAGESGELKHYIGDTVNAGLNTGYSEDETIGADDPHFGWTLGRFFVSGFTRVTEDEDGDAVFLKTPGDKVALWFALEQDIDKLNDNDKLTVVDDADGYDEYFGIEKTDFGRGTLVVRHTDYQDYTNAPVIYTDYLSGVAAGAETQVELFEEGDYEVALNYELKNTWQRVLDVNIGDFHSNYRIFFRFSVRNGNCMVYPFDIATKAELTNSSITDNGFYLDLAKSRYLDINIKKEMLADGADGLTEDTRFNRPAKDGDEYTDEGIYTVTAKNNYTDETTEKKIYVGTNEILIAHMVTGLPVLEIKSQLASGATIREDGTIEPPPTPSPTPSPTATPQPDTAEVSEEVSEPPAETPAPEPEDTSGPPILPVVIAVIVAIALFAILFRNRLRPKHDTAMPSNSNGKRED